MDDVKVWQQDDCKFFQRDEDRKSRAMYELPHSYPVQIVPGKRAFLLVETDDPKEATHGTNPRSTPSGIINLGMYRLDDRSEFNPLYKLIPLTPPEPTPEEIAERAKEAAWKAFRQSLDGSGKDYHTVFSAGYDAALAAAKK